MELVDVYRRAPGCCSVWAANAHDVYRHLWMTLIGTQP